MKINHTHRIHTKTSKQTHKNTPKNRVIHTSIKEHKIIQNNIKNNQNSFHNNIRLKLPYNQYNLQLKL